MDAIPTPPHGDLVQVRAPHFCAVMVVHEGRCIFAAPILRWALGYEALKLSAYFKLKGWQAVIVPRSTALDVDPLDRSV
jgi:hypothetical protein